MRVELHADARVELHNSAVWYDEQRIGWGDEFIGEISAALRRIIERPESFPKWPGVGKTAPIRKATIHRFPYVIAFEQHEEYVLVLAVAHARRRPLYWLARGTR